MSLVIPPHGQQPTFPLDVVEGNEPGLPPDGGATPTPARAAVAGPCCGDFRPRLNERNGRFFCASCRSYIDHRQTTQSHSVDNRTPQRVSFQPTAMPLKASPQEGDLLGY